MTKAFAPEKRMATRELLDRYYSVEFKAGNCGDVYQFKLRDLSPQGLAIWVRQDSAALLHLKVGDTLLMKLYPPDQEGYPFRLQAEVRHISPAGPGLPGEHVTVGFEVGNLQPLPPD